VRVCDRGMIFTEADEGNTLVIMKQSGYLAMVNGFIVQNQISQMSRDRSMTDQFQKQIISNI
jgi:hypothetical protein